MYIEPTAKVKLEMRDIYLHDHQSPSWCFCNLEPPEDVLTMSG